MKKGFSLVYSVLLVCILSGISVAGEGYVIGDEDMLQLSVWGSPDLTVQVPVRPDGMISFPIVGDVKASGLSPQELKTVLEKELAKYIKSPTVSVIVTAINSFKVYVLGEGLSGGSVSGEATPAGGSGVITLRRNTSLMQLLAQLGSMKGADLNSAYILRDGKRLGNDFFKLTVKGDVSQDIQLKSNDILFIPDNFDKRIMVIGAVKTPIIIQYREGLTVLDAILGAGGFTEYAKQNDVLVVRKSGKETKNIEARMKDVVNGDISKDVPLMPGDLVIIKTGMF
jgi:polysaccharide biosynthesis/export protein